MFGAGSDEPPLVAAELLETEHGLLAGHGCSEEGPYLLIDRMDETPWRREVVRVREQTFTLEAHADRHCSGRSDLETGRATPCPARARLGSDALQQCNACFAATGFNPAFYNTTVISVSQRRRNAEPHAVYLASFGLGAIKVGMTYAPRRLSRLLEQGARLGAIIAELPDADRARDLEAFVARGPGVMEAVRSARKRQLLGVPLDAAAARRELEARVRELARLRPDVDAGATVRELDAFYGPPRLLAGPLTDLSGTEPLAISGQCLGMVGDALIMLQGGFRYMLSVGDMLGRRVSVRRSERANRFVGQLGLPF